MNCTYYDFYQFMQKCYLGKLDLNRFLRWSDDFFQQFGKELKSLSKSTKRHQCPTTIYILHIFIRLKSMVETSVTSITFLKDLNLKLWKDGGGKTFML